MLLIQKPAYRYFWLWLCLHFGLPGPVAAALWPQASPVPGGVAVLELPQKGSAPPHAFFQGKRVYTAQRDGVWYAWVGIPLDHPPGPSQLHWRTRDGDVPLPFVVKPKAYPEQQLSVAPRHVELSAQDAARVQRETPELRQAMDFFRPVQDPLPAVLRQPVSGRHSSAFGLRRVFNGQPRNPHTGLDIAAPRGTPVQAPLPGRVRAKNDYFFNGKTLVLDHGQGLTSLYCHLDDFADVRIGDQVDQGQVLGFVGSTGRSTGPHLHWTISLNGARVDPLLFLKPAP